MEDNSPESATSQVAPPSIVEQSELEQVQQQLISAWIHRDRLALERLLAQEWMVTHADARMSTRDEVLRDLDTGANRLLEGAVDDLRFRVYKDFAVITGRTSARGEYKGHAYDVRLRFTDVLVHRDKRWQVVASHASRLPTGEPSSAVNKEA